MANMKIVLGPYQSRLHAPKNIISQLRTVMRARVEGFEYTDAYERGWDGYKYFLTPGGLFLSGLVKYVVDIIQKNYGEVEIEGTREPLGKDFVPDVGNGWILDDRQQEVVTKLLNYTYPNGEVCTHGTIDAAVNSGKTPIFANLIYNCPDKKFLILCASTLVFEKTVKFFFEIYGEDDIGIIQGKTTRIRRVTIAMVPSLRNQLNRNPKELQNAFDVLIADESHNLSNKTGQTILSKLKCTHRYFFSGTAYAQGDAVKKIEMMGLAGYPIAKITNKENQESGRSLQANVHIHPIKYYLTGRSRDNLLYLQTNMNRNNKIANIVKENQHKKVLIVCRYIDHAEILLNYIEGVECTHGEDPDKDIKIRAFARDPVGKLLTTFIIKEGVNIPDIQVLINVFGGEDEVSVKQVSGRVIRDDGVSESVDIHDFYDIDGGNLERHSKQRIKYYESEGYKINHL